MRNERLEGYCWRDAGATRNACLRAPTEDAVAALDGSTSRNDSYWRSGGSQDEGAETEAVVSGVADRKVEMKLAQPVFEYIKPPRLTDLEHNVLVKFVRDRQQFKERIWERCLATGEAHETVFGGIKSSMEPRVLKHLVHYEFRIRRTKRRKSRAVLAR
ncbi:hypothetical protein PInf_004463 [Phytophthora infestans]|nr:hypothetical protein PInf_004463 [Phytophthora infestans]